MKIIVPVLFLFTFIACQEPQENATRTTASDSVSPVAAVAPETRTVAEEEAARYPGDTGYIARILTTGSFHADEVQNTDAKKNWMGIFKSDSGYYLAAANIQLERTNDAVVDEDGEKTGWEVKTDHPDSVILLIGGLDFLRERPVPEVSLSRDQLQPGDSLAFQFSGVSYVLHATGDKTSSNGESQVENYKLYLSAIKEGHRTTELLTAQPNFDDNMIKILFAGDIDGDGQLDLLIDTSWHYNVTAPTLYLSKPSETGHLLKVTGKHSSVGC